jgi:hypothetical protein
LAKLACASDGAVTSFIATFLVFSLRHDKARKGARQRGASV